MQAMHAMLQELPEQKFRSGPSCSALYTNVIAMCGQQVQWQRALFWIQHMSDQNFAASTVPYTAAMAACADSDQWQAALVLLSHLEEEKCQLDAVTYSPIIASCHWQISLVLVSEMGAEDYTTEPDNSKFCHSRLWEVEQVDRSLAALSWLRRSRH